MSVIFSSHSSMYHSWSKENGAVSPGNSQSRSPQRWWSYHFLSYSIYTVSHFERLSPISLILLSSSTLMDCFSSYRAFFNLHINMTPESLRLFHVQLRIVQVALEKSHDSGHSGALRDPTARSAEEYVWWRNSQHENSFNCSPLSSLEENSFITSLAL